eukprot:snap_masked-scaffold_48-processed-gene-1.90-mRNA-1 protein AED:1.00 eAED:1.00 QI:0/0/0/0/1/1/2/0/318
MIIENISKVPKNVWLKERIKIIRYPIRIRSMSEGVSEGLSRSKDWSFEQKVVFEKLSLEFGIGNWKEICSLGSLSRKTKSHMVTLLQASLGSQSIEVYRMFKVRFEKIKEYNDSLQNVYRRNGIIVRTGKERSPFELKKKFEAQSDREHIEVPVLNVSDLNNPRLMLQDIRKMIKFINNFNIKKKFKESVNHIEDNAVEVAWQKDSFRSKFGNKWYRVLLDSGAGISCIGSSMVSSSELKVEGEELTRLSNVFGVSGRKLEIVGYVWKEINLIHPRVKMSLGKVCLYVLKRSMNKVIIGEKALKKYKLRPVDVLMGEM